MNLSRKFLISILLNITITLVEILGGLLSGSLALISDAIHNLSDVLSLIIGYLGERISKKPADERHTFGFKRSEILAALLNAVFLFAVAIWIVIEIVKRFTHPEPIELGVMSVAAVIGLLGNFFSILMLHSHKEHSINVKAAYLHLFYDTLSSVLVVIAVPVIYFTGFVFFDPIISFLIVILMLKSAYELLKNTVHILMMGVPEGFDINEIAREIKKIDGVDDIHSIHVWSVDSKEIFLSCHLVASSSDTDSILKRVQDTLKDKFGITHTTIQIEKEKICDSGLICENHAGG